MGTYTTREVKDIMRLKEQWDAYEHDNWRLISFSAKEARFGWIEGNLQYTKYVIVTRSQVDFLIGVPPDVLDQY